MSESPPKHEPESVAPMMSLRRSRILTLLIAALVFCSVAPTLTWPQFTGGNENIVVQTALEMRRGGPWLVPQMMGEPRVKKPPLVAWITAASMRDSTIRLLDIPHTREKAYRDLTWQVRWTGLLAGCVLIVATGALGRVIMNPTIGVLSAAVVGTTLLFQQYMRQTTSDVHLAMWVVIANVCIAHGLMRGRWWLAATFGAAATGLAFLCKGPVALLETLLPMVSFAVYLRYSRNAGSRPSPGGEGVKMRAIQGFVAITIFALIALPWFIHVYNTVPNVWQTWFSEVTREGATDLQPGSPATYLMLIPTAWPWAVFLVVGVLGIIRFRDHRMLLPAMQILLPLLVMVFFRDRKPRYLLPMIGPAAVICGYGIWVFLRSLKSTERWPRVVEVIHLVLLGALAIGVPIAGATHPEMRTVTGEPWYPMPLAVWMAVGMASLILLGLIIYRRRPVAIVVTTFLVMLALQAIVIFGYQASSNGMSAFKRLADKIHESVPTASVYDWNADGRRVDEEMAIYLNRTILFADPATLSPEARPQVYITRQGRNKQGTRDPDPVPPPGWRFLASTRERKNVWWAFVRLPG